MKTPRKNSRSGATISAALDRSLSRYVIAGASLAAAAIPVTARANFSGPYDVANWTLQNTGGSTDGHVDIGLAPNSILLSGGRSQSGTPGTTDFTITAVASGLLTFTWAYFSSDTLPTDGGNFLLNGVPTFLADNSSPGTGNFSVLLNQGDVFGFEAFTLNNLGDPAQLRISNFNGPLPSGVPENGSTLGLLALGVAGVEILRRRIR